MSPESNFEFKDFIPPELYKQYFDIVVANEKVYVVVITNENQVNTVYLEAPRKQDKDLDGFIRVFFDVGHMKQYGSQIAMREQIHPDLVKRWELPFNELVEYVKTMDERRRANNKPGVMAIAYSIHAQKFIEIDTVWTSDTNVMV